MDLDKIILQHPIKSQLRARQFTYTELHQKIKSILGNAAPSRSRLWEMISIKEEMSDEVKHALEQVIIDYDAKLASKINMLENDVPTESK